MISAQMTNSRFPSAQSGVLTTELGSDAKRVYLGTTWLVDLRRVRSFLSCWVFNRTYYSGTGVFLTPVIYNHFYD